MYSIIVTIPNVNIVYIESCTFDGRFKQRKEFMSSNPFNLSDRINIEILLPVSFCIPTNK